VNTQRTSPARRSLQARGSLLADPQSQLATLDDVPLAGDAAFDRTLEAAGVPLAPANVDILQINVGKLCNMTCQHCHVDAGPDRTDAMMSRPVLEACVDAADRLGVQTVDITGGAPELHPDFRWLVRTLAPTGRHLIDRCNLSVLLLPRHSDLPGLLADHGVEVVASLPHYRRRNTDAQRGDGAFEDSLEGIRRLNAVGYGAGDPARTLTLMSNPSGAFLAGSQAELEADWKARLWEDHGLRFDRLLVLNNMPISRFLEWLVERGQLQAYMERLLQAFNPAAVAGLMCRTTLSVGWDGRLYDCDFNQMLDLPIPGPDGRALTLDGVDAALLARRRIRTARHCFGCTAGEGSSCGGATTGA
jgi:radical SAM/Cys-rich protein